MNFETMSDKEILGIATPIMDNLMDASTRIDYEAHVRCVSSIKRRKDSSLTVSQSLSLSGLTR